MTTWKHLLDTSGKLPIWTPVIVTTGSSFAQALSIKNP